MSCKVHTVLSFSGPYCCTLHRTSVWWQAAQQSSLFQFAVSWCPPGDLSLLSFGKTREVTDYTITWCMSCTCWITNTTDTFRIGNSYGFYTTTVVTQTRLNVMFIRTLSVYALIQAWKFKLKIHWQKWIQTCKMHQGWLVGKSNNYVVFATLRHEFHPTNINLKFSESK